MKPGLVGAATMIFTVSFAFSLANGQATSVEEAKKLSMATGRPILAVAGNKK